MTAGEKADLRKLALTRRKAAHAPERGAAACDRLVEMLAAEYGRPVAGYMPIRSEIDPRPAMADLSRQGPVGVPVIEAPGRPLSFHLWTPECALVDGPFGAAVPATAMPMVPEILIVPLVAFDRSCNRLGYGGGFYDRTIAALAALGPIRTIGLAYAAQELPRIPTEPTDRKLDAIVTENETIER
ncbi:5-formyltetrahydrofolate cyclo-ligase [Rhodovulum sp. P5]|uniref:5-formyltetrahydrofolate cyclo-ligase n=1 Tax=Rhodovulum sp. P5 TaxID=1564506 RepID=UPI0009C3CAA1|nr:5-formyltetrahydrofolate cyclo-ligase [Rhodovulum sp. P5]ARE41933.1 5-formyltetrahydrofolate cyclo-ligase [Rhodovulum sp. P5]